MAATTTRSPHLRWLNQAEHWGEWQRVPDDEPGAAESIWMMRGAKGRVRFYAIGKGQIGSEHAHVVAASTWAWANGWLWCEPGGGGVDLLAQLACRKWVIAGGAPDGEHA